MNYFQEKANRMKSILEEHDRILNAIAKIPCSQDLNIQINKIEKSFNKK